MATEAWVFLLAALMNFIAAYYNFDNKPLHYVYMFFGAFWFCTYVVS